MVDILIKRYLWLIHLLLESGELGFDEIARRWERSAVNDYNTKLTRRTFYNHCKAITKHFGIDIACRRGRGLNLYSISNPEGLHDNMMTRWVLDNFATSTLLLDNASIGHKILLEEIPSGRKWLPAILSCLKTNEALHISYENFIHLKYEGVINPLCVKLFKRRWYMLCSVPEANSAPYRIFALDRIMHLTKLNTTFCYPQEFNPAEFFNNYFGIFAITPIHTQHIKLRAYAELPNYLRSLPLHPSQKEEAVTDKYTDFTLYLAPTFDFIQEILIHHNQIEVLQPHSLRSTIRTLLYSTLQLYDRH